MSSRRDLVLLVLTGLGLHLAACYPLGYLPPDRAFEVLVTALPLALGAGAVLAVLLRDEPRPLQAGCVLEWLLVLFALPANFSGLWFVPSAAVLSLAVARVPTGSPDPADGVS